MSSNVTSSNKDLEAQIDRCLELISPSASDESKFVGMMLLPRLLKQDDVTSVQRVFDGMNFKFIERLLRSSEQPNAEIPQTVLKEIGVSILACFARYEDMASRKQMTDRIPAVSTVLSPNDATDVTKESLHILLCVAVTKEGLVRMLDPDVLKNIFEIVIESNSITEAERELGVQVVKSVYARACHQLHNGSVPSLASALKYSLRTIMDICSNVFNKDQNHLKFAALDILSQILPDVPSEIMQKFKYESEKSSTSWLQSIRSGLRQVLSNKVAHQEAGDNVRDRAMLITACLLRYFGTDWLFASLQATRQSRKQKEKKPAHRADEAHADAYFPALLIHLVAVETRVMIDDINDHLHEVYEGRKSDILEEEKKLRQDTIVPVLFEILESAIHYLSTHYSEKEESGMDPEMLLKVRTALTDTMDVVMELLQFMQTSQTDEQLAESMVAQASMRIVALWLAEEGYEL
ncbi:hypothetical protein EC973_002304 [Apophysomyces ossiformis]|uniref:Neurochondrin-like protein n=1 Tax=Apophysomyces ossiformis TaxID=679940 RepID=A0A8H7EMN4_9FUNG|nr:hypothetical protein EC973_002304 [Apophysomyces ossiformis]